MSDIAIRTSRLGKRYRIGVQKQRSTLWIGDVSRRVTKMIRHPFRGWNREAADSRADYIWALRNVSFEVQHGEVVGIIGGNGSGKSTLLKILARITDPTIGVGELYGRVGSLLEVGTGFHPELTGRENIYLNAAILGMRRAELGRKFDEIVDFSGIEKFLDTPVKHYSSGMYVRLAFAVAAHLEPEILLVDEVLAVGDVAFQRKCLGKIHDVSKQGRTVLFVSHNMAAIRSLCSRCLELDAGTIVGSGEPEEVSTRYEARVVDTVRENRPVLPIVSKRHGVALTHAQADVTRTGRHAHLSLELRVSTKQFERMSVGVWISTARGDLVAKLRPELTNAFVDVVDGEGYCLFACDSVDRFLATGTYTVTLRFGGNGQLVLAADHVVSFQIPDCDPFGTQSAFTLYEHGVVPLPLKPRMDTKRNGAGALFVTKTPDRMGY